MPYFWILALIFGFVLIKHAMEMRAKQEQAKLRVLEEALKHGNLDEESKEQLMQSLTGHSTGSDPKTQPASSPPPPRIIPRQTDVGVVLKLVTFLGWISLCLGIAFVIAVVNSDVYKRDLALPAVILSCVGFGLVTFPFVIRELQSVPRRHFREPIS